MTNLKPDKNNPTVQDVARAANVSTATVSRALSAPERVSEKARKKVDDAVKLTGYVINHSARNLRRQQTVTIVSLVPDIGNSHFSNILKGIETVCADRDINVLIADTRKQHVLGNIILGDGDGTNGEQRSLRLLDGHCKKKCNTNIKRSRITPPSDFTTMLGGCVFKLILETATTK